MSTPNGYSSQEKDDRLKAEFSTVQPVSEKRHALEVYASFYHQLITAADIIDGLILDKNGAVIGINATAHGARVGDLIHFKSGLSLDRQMKVWAITDANNFLLAESISVDLPIATDTFDLLRATQPRVNASGDLFVTPGPIIFTLDGADQVVTEDTVTPANNAPLPVKLTGVTGDINITAGDLNVQTSHLGASFDSMRIGDGTVLFSAAQKSSALSFPVVLSTEQEALIDGIEALLATIDADTSNIATDTAVIAGDTTSLDGKLLAGQQASAASLAVVLSTEQEALIDGIEALLATIDADTSSIATDAGTIAGDTTSIDGKLPATLGQKASVASLAVALSTEQEALIDGIEGLLATIDADTGVIAGDTTSIDGKLALGQQASAASLAVVLSTEQEALIDGIEALLATIDADTGVIAGDTTSIDGKLALGQQASAASLAVVLSTEQEAMIDGLEGLLTSIDGKTVSALDTVRTDIIDLNTQDDATWTELVASTASAIKKVGSFMSSGRVLEFGTGAAASEVRKFLLAPGGFPGQQIEVDIPAATRISYRFVASEGTGAAGERAVLNWQG